MINGIDPTIPVIYGICVLFSATLLTCYLLFVKEKHIWMKLILASVCVVNVGYLYLSLSPDLAHALMANRIAYLGNAFQPVFMLFTVANLCRIKIKTPIAIGLLAFAGMMFLGACSVGILPIFYETVEYSVAGGVVKLIKTYGFLHAFYAIYVVAFMFAVIGVTVYSIIKKKLVFYRYIVMTVMIATVNAAVWFVERFVRGNYEFLSASYIFTCLLMVLLYSELSEHGFLDSFNTVIATKSDTAKGDAPKAPFAKGETDMDGSAAHTSIVHVDFQDKETLTRVCQYYADNPVISSREVEVLALILQGCTRKEIAERLFITEGTVKSHRAKIYAKLGVSSKEELLARIIEDVRLTV